MGFHVSHVLHVSARWGRAWVTFYGHVSRGFSRIFSFILVIRAIRGVLFHGAPRIARITRMGSFGTSFINLKLITWNLELETNLQRGGRADGVD